MVNREGEQKQTEPKKCDWPEYDFEYEKDRGMYNSKVRFVTGKKTGLLKKLRIILRLHISLCLIHPQEPYSTWEEK